MRSRYRIYRRQGGVFYLFDRHTGKRQSLQTTDKASALRLVQANNEAQRDPAVNLQIAKAYLTAFDPQMTKRTWWHVMEEIPKLKRGNTRLRWLTAIRDKAFRSLRDRTLLETRAEHFLAVLERGSVSTNSYLRRMHQFALDMNWLPWPVLPRKRWPALQFKQKRAITEEEHHKILGGENNPEWQAFYRVLWHLGGSQTDMATLCAEDINWADRTIAYARRKTGTVSVIHFGPSMAEILRSRPQTGFLFPMIARWKEADRGKAFIRRCRLAGVAGVSLHSYRYAWAERAKQCGYPERFAQEALGHNSKAIHRAYARKAQVVLPPLEQYEHKPAKGKVVTLRAARTRAALAIQESGADAQHEVGGNLLRRLPTVS